MPAICQFNICQANRNGVALFPIDLDEQGELASVGDWSKKLAALSGVGLQARGVAARLWRPLTTMRVGLGWRDAQQLRA